MEEQIDKCEEVTCWAETWQQLLATISYLTADSWILPMPLTKSIVKSYCKHSSSSPYTRRCYGQLAIWRTIIDPVRIRSKRSDLSSKVGFGLSHCNLVCRLSWHCTKIIHKFPAYLAAANLPSTSSNCRPNNSLLPKAGTTSSHHWFCRIACLWNSLGPTLTVHLSVLLEALTLNIVCANLLTTASFAVAYHSRLHANLKCPLVSHCKHLWETSLMSLCLWRIH